MSRLVRTLSLLAWPCVSRAQGVHGVPMILWLAIAAAVLLFATLGLFVFILVRNERRRAAAMAPEPRRRRAAEMPHNPAWRDTGTGRRSRDPTDLRLVDEDLPPITLMTGAVWADKTEEEAPRQSALIAGAPAAEQANIYRSGYNPFFRNVNTEQIEVEEVADLVQQAELMMTLSNYPAAISMLTRHIRDTETPAPKAWLMLFDLYARTEREDQYNNLAKGFRIQFNAEVPSWKSQRTEVSRQLEDYPQVMERICKAWPTDAIRPLLQSLLYDDRGGARAGFMLAAYNDLIFLSEIIELLDSIERELIERREIERKLQSRPLI